MSDHQETWAELNPQETLQTTNVLYKDLKNLIVFGVFNNGTVGTLFTSNSSSMSLMWILKAMDWDAVSDAQDPIPLTEKSHKAAKKHLNDDKKKHPVITQALKQMADVQHVIVAGLTDDNELTMATSKDVDFMMTSFCVDWFRHQLLSQMNAAAIAAQQQAAQQQQAQTTQKK